MNINGGDIISVSMVIMIILIVYYITKYKYKLKKAIIDKGGAVELPKNNSPFLEIGCAAVGLGLGLGLSAIFQKINIPENARILISFSFSLIFGGLGLVAAFFIRKRVEQD